MKRKLTDRFIESIQPPETGRDVYSDTLRTGLQLRVGSSRMAWMFEKRVKNGPKRKHTLGTWPELRLAEARAMALEIENEAMRGIDRVADAQKARAAHELAMASRVTIGELLSKYEQIKLQNLATGSEVSRELRKALGEPLERPCEALTQAQLQTAIDDRIAAGRLVYANRLRSYLRAFTKWAARRGYLRTDIGFALDGGPKEQARDRVLSIAEVREIYNACEALEYPWRQMFRLLTLTGQRRGEIAQLRWANIDFDACQIVLEGRQTKNRKPHIVHLSQPALEELALVQERRDNSAFLFTTTGATPSSGISKAKRRLDGLLGAEFEPWRLHDLRRAMATALAEAGIAEGVVDRIQNHAASGSAPSAVARVYQQSELLGQRKNALIRWGNMALDPDYSSTIVKLTSARPEKT